MRCPPGWRPDGPAADGRGAAALSPDGTQRLVVHLAVHDAREGGPDFAARMQAAAARVLSHLAAQPGAAAPEIVTISGASQPILEIGSTFYDDAQTPLTLIRQWHAIAPLDADAGQLAVVAFSLMTPALRPTAASADLATGFQTGLRAAAAAIVDAGGDAD